MVQNHFAVAGYIFHEDKLLLIHHKKTGLWLPVGGHVDFNEIPDDAMIREAKEETSLEISLLNQSPIPMLGNTNRNLSTPFYANVHSVGDHNHYCFFYICKVMDPVRIKINEDEIKGYDWFFKKDLGWKGLPEDVAEIGCFAFDTYRETRSY